MDKLKEVDWRGLYKSATAKVKKYTLNLTDLEIKVEEATNSETWGPHGSVMNEIADSAFDPENYRQIMGVLARRLQERDNNWRMCYKALLLLEHLIKHGPGKIVGDVQSSAWVLDRLQRFEYKDPNMKDHGVNVRHRAKEILELVNSPGRLQEEREKAKANRAKYRGVSADQLRSQSFSRFASDHYSSGTSGSLFPGGGGSSAGSLGGGGSMGGGTSYAASRRSNSYDETHEGAHYISKRGGGDDGGILGAGAASSAEAATRSAGGGGEDPMAATRARIDRLKLAEDRLVAAEDSKKKLTDVRVNPKIAASLGLKMLAATPSPAAAPAASVFAAPLAAAAPSASAIDLLGGLDQQEPAAAMAAPAPAAPAASFDPFAAPVAPAPAAAATAAQQGGWGAFGAPVPAPGHAASLDMLGGLDFGAPVAPPPLAASAYQRPLAAAMPLDPFPSFTSAPPVPLMAPRPAAPIPATPVPSVMAGVPTALPEDMFSELTGIGSRAQQPMGVAGHGPAAYPSSAAAAAATPPAGMLGGMGGGGVGMGWGMPAPSPPSPGGGFGSFSGGSGFTPQAQAQPAGYGRTGSVGFGSLSCSSVPQGGASAADPFADLLK